MLFVFTPCTGRHITITYNNIDYIVRRANIYYMMVLMVMRYSTAKLCYASPPPQSLMKEIPCPSTKYIAFVITGLCLIVYLRRGSSLCDNDILG